MFFPKNSFLRKTMFTHRWSCVMRFDMCVFVSLSQGGGEAEVGGGAEPQAGGGGGQPGGDGAHPDGAAGGGAGGGRQEGREGDHREAAEGHGRPAEELRTTTRAAGYCSLTTLRHTSSHYVITCMLL